MSAGGTCRTVGLSLSPTATPERDKLSPGGVWGPSATIEARQRRTTVSSRDLKYVTNCPQTRNATWCHSGHATRRDSLIRTPRRSLVEATTTISSAGVESGRLENKCKAASQGSNMAVSGRHVCTGFGCAQQSEDYVFISMWSAAYVN
ncbi:hypothetical protein Bbelb_204290 [Branchiostoma belcheri]|nr:hypothetical protein Bbelb_204290 [Branchiostoma belcheri]